MLITRSMYCHLTATISVGLGSSGLKRHEYNIIFLIGPSQEKILRAPLTVTALMTKAENYMPSGVVRFRL